MTKQSAGLLMYRRRGGLLEVFLVHPGGPYWEKKDLGAWSIPKGLFTDEENALDAAKREFEEETGFQAKGSCRPLTPRRQLSGKIVSVWAFEGDGDPAAIKSNTFLMEWPPHSGKQQAFPEVDRAEWFTIERAKEKIVSGQVGFLEELERMIEGEDL